MKKTVVQHISPVSPDPASIEAAAVVLRAGGLVAFPTETVYGLGADAINAVAVASVFATKGRPADNPLIVHIAELEQMYDLTAEVPEVASTLVKKFWPGPLTLILKAREFVPRIVTGGLDTVAIRMPAHKVPLQLIRKLTHGMVGPSANISGRPSPTTAQHVFDDFDGKIDMILDAGPTTIGVESTVIDVTVSPPVILRLGGVPREEIEKLIGPVQTTRSQALLKRSPGSRYRHYAPKARVILIDEGNLEAYGAMMQQCLDQQLKVGAIIHSETLGKVQQTSQMRILIFPPSEYPKRLFDSLRQLDRSGVDVIIVESVPDRGVGAAVMDRLRRAAE